LKHNEAIATLSSLLPFDPTGDQETALSHIAAFEKSSKHKPIYVLKGYAGTGKTSLISVYVKYLVQNKRTFELMAPTGRAAKVLAYYTGFRANTIHRQIYQIITSGDGYTRLLLAQNPHENTVFIVDEASMINDNRQQDGELFGSRNLLDDLVNYVFSNKNNRLMLVGDTAQLPPVGLDISPALNIDYIKTAFHVTAFAFEMKEVKRQSLDSGVLYAATDLRNKIGRGDDELPYFNPDGFRNDVLRINNGSDLEELLNLTFQSRDFDKGIVVCRSNKRANLFNEQVRSRILQHENEIEGGDYLMVVRNNYFWLEEDSKAGFIANGDLIRIVRIRKTEQMYGFQFADAEIELLDYPEEKEIEVKLLLNTLTTEGPALSRNDYDELFSRVEEDYMDIPERRKRINKIRKNPWFNALQVKFAYAMTCHKTQGGQWPMVIVDQGYLTDEMMGVEYQRWLYTAITRSTDKVFLVNFKGDFFE
jgi:exodeoxyribonuclease-5